MSYLCGQHNFIYLTIKFNKVINMGLEINIMTGINGNVDSFMKDIRQDDDFRGIYAGDFRNDMLFYRIYEVDESDLAGCIRKYDDLLNGRLGVKDVYEKCMKQEGESKAILNLSPIDILGSYFAKKHGSYTEDYQKIFDQLPSRVKKEVRKLTNDIARVFYVDDTEDATEFQKIRAEHMKGLYSVLGIEVTYVNDVEDLKKEMNLPEFKVCKNNKYNLSA